METTERLYGLSFTQREGLPKFGTDALLLADFAPPVRGRFADLCCGTGILGVLLCARNPGAALTAVELDPAAAGLAERNLARNGFAARTRVICGDVRDPACLPAPNSLSLIVCNPPYFDPAAGGASPSAARRRSRTEESCSIADVCAAARRCLAHRGRLCLLWRPERLAALTDALAAAGLAPKRLRFVHPRADRPAKLVLAEARKGCADGLAVEPPLVLAEADGSPSAEYRRIYQL